MKAVFQDSLRRQSSFNKGKLQIIQISSNKKYIMIACECLNGKLDYGKAIHSIILWPWK